MRKDKDERDSATKSSSAVQPLEYDRSAAVTRRQFRWLMALTLLNTVLLAAVVVGPMMAPYAQQQWKDWKQRRAEAAKRKQVNAAFEQCMKYTAPPTTVVYEEDPDRASALASNGAGYRVHNPGSGPLGWHPPVIAKPPESVQLLGGVSDAVLFLHERSTPSGQRRLVIVTHATYQRFASVIAASVEGTPRTWQLVKDRKLAASVHELEPSDGKKEIVARYDFSVILGDERIERFAITWPHKPLERVQFKEEQRLRIFAGQPDEKDPSRFTIAYELNDRPGVIDGWLTETDVVLRPRQGELMTREGEPAWDFRATTQSTTTRATN